MIKKYDVVVLGGGLAGLTLAIQLKQENSKLKILVLEKRIDSAPLAIHKVGESSSELGSFYLRDVLNLKNYLNEKQLPKFGFRFFLSEQHSDDIAKRVEVGSRILSPYPTHQIDRGILENDLSDMLLQIGVDFLLGTKVVDVKIEKENHWVTYENIALNEEVECRWVVDTTGRSSFLKKKLKLGKELAHNINSSWFRLACEIDPDDWSENKDWLNRVDPGRRRLATNHLMGKGYWIWIIPLISGSTSIGIVADPEFHPFDQINTFEKALSWMEKYEPLAAKIFKKQQEKALDFKVMKNFAYDSKQFYSVDRWAVTGEAGAFMDPFYSPGSDFIGLGNSWVSDLINRDFKGEDIQLRTMIFELTHKELLKGWISLYQNMYSVFGNTQIMLMKIVWDWASYWAIPCVLFMNKGYVNVNVMKQYSANQNSIGQRFALLNEKMQKLFRDWDQFETELLSNHYSNVFDLKILHQFQSELPLRYEENELVQKINSNLSILEQLAAEIFRKVSTEIHATPFDMPVNPYSADLNNDKVEWIEKSKDEKSITFNESINEDLNVMWILPQNIKCTTDV